MYKDIQGADVNSELTADLVGDYLFTDNNFISELSTQKPTVFQKIFSLFAVQTVIKYAPGEE